MVSLPGQSPHGWITHIRGQLTTKYPTGGVDRAYRLALFACGWKTEAGRDEVFWPGVTQEACEEEGGKPGLQADRWATLRF